ncbi:MULTISPECIES: DUF6160 family protein [Acinetobacter]|uniref:DUF6160 family protein n=1 Tax=Acinetobacter TaxID=469 RepID=UPI00051BA67F|nr:MULTISPECIES: DUF6160 family protein [Acinetobacter]MCH7379406.1 heme utilization protein [Acinetobacter higginsii]MCJ0829038.1 heme utilization protein [Acinetobacter sp. NIPH1876]MDO3664954.1 heme utilization protein [Acinetobacter higginsii]
MKKNNQNHNLTLFVLNTLTASIFLINSAHALQSLDDNALRSVNGQDGVHIATSYDEINVDKFYWEDDAGRGSTDKAYTKTLRATAEGFKIKATNANVSNLAIANRTPGTDYKINVGSGIGADTGKTGLDLMLSTNPSLITIDNFNICDTESSQRCGVPIGSVAMQTSSVIDIAFKTRDGLFSKDKQAVLDLGLKNANIYLGQKDVSGELNQLILKNFNFNFLGKGVMFIDASGGFKLQTNADGVSKATINMAPDSTHGYVDFRRTPDSASANLKNNGSYGDATSTTPNGTTTTNAGLNLEFMLNKNVDKNSPYTLNTTNSPTNATGLIRVGASGRMVNGYLQLRGLNADGKNNPDYTGLNYGNADNSNIVGKVNNSSTNLSLAANNPITSAAGENIMGKTGIAFRMAAEFTQDNDLMLGSDGKATTLEIGNAGLNTYGFEFGNLTGLVATNRGSFDSGNVYINLADTKTLLLPANKSFQTSRFGNGNFLTNNNDYIQYIYTNTPDGIQINQNPYSLLVAIRGSEFQAISRRGRFTNSARTNDAFGNSVPNIVEHDGQNGTTLNEWGLALPIYNLNANIALFGTNVDASTAYAYTTDYKGYNKSPSNKVVIGAVGQKTPRLGFSLAMSTQGVSDDGAKTTSIMVIDGKKVNGQPTDYYMGLRNIDMLIKGTGSIGVEKGSLNVSLKDMLIVAAAQVAAGYLPGTTYSRCVQNVSNSGCSAVAANNKVPLNNFSLSNDVLLGVKLRIGGSMDFSLIPNGEYRADGTGSSLNIVGDLSLDKNQNNTIQISDPVDGSTIGLDNLMGKMAFNNSIVIGRHSSGEGVVSFNTAINFNPDKNAADVFRARDINFYPPSSGSSKRLGELAITGGRLNSSLSIVPRNGNFTN